MLNLNSSASLTILNRFFCNDDPENNLIFVFSAFYNEEDLKFKSTYDIKKDTTDVIKKCYILISQKTIKFFKEDFMSLFLTIPYLNIKDIQQDINNQNYIEIIFLLENNKNKIEIVIENKNYFMENCLENYMYESTLKNENINFLEINEKKIDFMARYNPTIGMGNQNLVILLKYKFVDKFQELNKLQQFMKISNPYSLDYEKQIHRFKKNLMFIPKNSIQVSNDTFMIHNPNNEYPIKLILESSNTLPVELLDYNSDLSDLKDIAYEKFHHTVKNILTDKFIITESSDFKRKINILNDRSKTQLWKIEGKSRIKNQKFFNVVMIMIRRSYYPPFFDTFKDYFVFVIEMNEIKNPKNFKKLNSVIIEKLVGQRTDTRGNANNMKYQLNYSEIDNKNNLNDKSDFLNVNEKINLSHDIKLDLGNRSIFKDNKNNISVTKNTKNNLNQSEISINENKNNNHNISQQEKLKNNKKNNQEYNQNNQGFHISVFARQIIYDIAESFNSMFSWNHSFLEKLKSLINIRLETFSCFKDYYDYGFNHIDNEPNIKKLKSLGVDLNYKILLILKEAANDEAIKYLKIVESIIKSSNTDGDHLTKLRQSLNSKDFYMLLEENEAFLRTIFLGYNKVPLDEKNDKKTNDKKTKDKKTALKPDPKTQTEEKSLNSKTKNFLNDNRNDFLVFSLTGKLVRFTLDMYQMIKTSYKKENTKVLIKNILNPLLNLKTTINDGTKTDKDIINEITDDKENHFTSITFDEDVMAAMIRSDFFRKNEIIINNESFENFIKFILENHGNNKILYSFFLFLKEARRENIDYNLLVKSNYKKIDTGSNNKSQIINQTILDNNQTFLKQNNDNISKMNTTDFNYTKSDIISVNNSFIGGHYMNTPNPVNYDANNNLNPDINNDKNFIVIVDNNFKKEKILSKKNDDAMKKNTESNMSWPKICIVLLKYYSNHKLNITKKILSCKSLYLLCKDDAINRRVMMEKSIFTVIFGYTKKFEDERILIESLKLFNSFLDFNDYSVITFLKKNDKWDDHLEYLAHKILNFSFQGIKYNKDIIISILDIFISLSKFTMIEMKSLFTKGIDYNPEKIQENQTQTENNEKNDNKILEFVQKILEDNYLKTCVDIPRFYVEIYEKNLILISNLLVFNYEMRQQKWFETIIILVVNRMELVLKNFEKFLKIRDMTPENDIPMEEFNYEADEFTYNIKIYFITWNFFKSIYNKKELKVLFNKYPVLKNILLFIKRYNSVLDFKYIYEKSKKLIETLEDKNHKK